MKCSAKVVYELVIFIVVDLVLIDYGRLEIVFDWIKLRPHKILLVLFSFSPPSPFFFKHMDSICLKKNGLWRFCYQKLSYLEGCMCEVSCTQTQCSFVEICEKPSWKLENVVSTI